MDRGYEMILWLKDPFIKGYTIVEMARTTPFTTRQVEGALPLLYALYGDLRKGVNRNDSQN